LGNGCAYKAHAKLSHCLTLSIGPRQIVNAGIGGSLTGAKHAHNHFLKIGESH
jgi:glucose-6-phosphate isomerase